MIKTERVLVPVPTDLTINQSVSRTYHAAFKDP